MKKHSNLAVLATVSMLALSVSCADKYQEGFDAGKREGYEEGYADGDADGYERAKEYFASADYNDGFNDGKAEGITIGYNQGYTVGKGDGYTEGYGVGKADGYSQGYNVGKADGYDMGYDDGYADGKFAGYNEGYLVGESVGLDAGFDLGFEAGEDYGFDIGYDAGWADAKAYYGFSVGKTPSLKGYANLLSMAHNDIFDYSKIPAPKQTKRGVLVNGQYLMSETSLTNKDTLKRAAVVEQYLVTEMAKQVKAKFGLSTGRALKFAKASHHFSKQASVRALTAEDTNAYVSEIIGTDLKTIENAVEQSRHGDISAISEVIANAAAKNEIKPEKMAEILATHF